MAKYKIRCKNKANIILDIYDSGNCYYTIYGKHTHGYYIAIPNWGICVEATEADDVIYNENKLAACKDKNVAIFSAHAIAAAIKEASAEAKE